MNHLAGKPMDFVYVASRGDGLHKIGCTGDVAQRRLILSKIYPKSLCPIRIVRSSDLQGLAPLIEKIAHYEMSSLGYEMQKMEWFEASARTCTNAVRRAVRLIDDIGMDGWAKVRSERRKRFLAEQLAIKTSAARYQHEMGVPPVRRERPSL